MSNMKLTDDEIAEIIASAQALSDMPPEERRAADLLKELLGDESASGSPELSERLAPCRHT